MFLSADQIHTCADSSKICRSAALPAAAQMSYPQYRCFQKTVRRKFRFTDDFHRTAEITVKAWSRSPVKNRILSGFEEPFLEFFDLAGKLSIHRRGLSQIRMFPGPNGLQHLFRLKSDLRNPGTPAGAEEAASQQSSAVPGRVHPAVATSAVRSPLPAENPSATQASHE